MNVRRLQFDGAEGNVQDVRTDESGSDRPHGLVRDGDLAHFFLGHPSQAPGELHRAHAVGSRVSESRFRPRFLTVVHKSSSAESTENGICPEYRLAAIYGHNRDGPCELYRGMVERYLLQSPPSYSSLVSPTHSTGLRPASRI
jgi:hypothetical protein